MAAAIGQYDRMIRDKEENQHAFAARFSKQEKSRNLPATTDSSKKGGKTPKCGYCHYTGYEKSKCYFLNTAIRPKGWELALGREHLMREN